MKKLVAALAVGLGLYGHFRAPQPEEVEGRLLSGEEMERVQREIEESGARPEGRAARRMASERNLVAGSGRAG